MIERALEKNELFEVGLKRFTSSASKSKIIKSASLSAKNSTVKNISPTKKPTIDKQDSTCSDHVYVDKKQLDDTNINNNKNNNNKSNKLEDSSNIVPKKLNYFIEIKCFFIYLKYY
jgi:hypothetical protein